MPILILRSLQKPLFHQPMQKNLHKYSSLLQTVPMPGLLLPLLRGRKGKRNIGRDDIDENHQLPIIGYLMPNMRKQ